MRNPFEPYEPTEEELGLGVEAYLRYVGGVAIVHNPSATAEQHGLNPTRHAKKILALANQAMLEGAQGVIQYSNPVTNRKTGARALIHAERRYRMALPTMLDIIDTTYRDHGDRLRDVSPSLTGYHPAAMKNPAVYQKITHGNLQRLTVHEMMDGVLPAHNMSSFANTNLSQTQQLLSAA